MEDSKSLGDSKMGTLSFGLQNTVNQKDFRRMGEHWD